MPPFSPHKPFSFLLLAALGSQICFPFLLPVKAADSDVIISEIAWMGSLIFNSETNEWEKSTADEWIELQNQTDQIIDLSGWTLNADDGSPEIDLEGIISAHGFFLLERTNDDSVPDVTADQIFTGALGNSGEHLILKDASETLVFEIDNSSEWEKGDSGTFQTMSIDSDQNWQDSTDPNGTPRAENFPSSDPDPDPTPPLLSDPTNFQAAAGDSEITLTWIQPASASGTIILGDTNPITFSFSGQTSLPGVGDTFSGSTATVIFSGSGSSHLVQNLTNEIPVFFQAHSFDPTPNFSTGVSASAIPSAPSEPEDKTPPAEVSDLQTIPGDQKITLSWINPSDSDFDSVRILHRTDTFPEPCDNEDDPDTLANLIPVNGSADSVLFETNLNNQEHFFRLCSRDFTGNLSSGLTISDIPFSPPPVIFSEIAWAGSSSSNADEWLELSNQTDQIIDLSNWTIWDEAEDTPELMLTIPENSQLGTGSNSLFLISNYDSSDSKSTLQITPDFVTTSVSLSNSSFHLSLKNSSGVTIDQAGNGSDPFAGDSTSSQKISMHRLSPLHFGTQISAWTGSTVSLNFDPGTPDLGTPGTGSDLIDTFPPAPISDLTAFQKTATGAFLTFSPSFDDGLSGNFASQVTIFQNDNPLPNPLSGSATSIFITPANPGDTFKLRSQDDQNLFSDFSNQVILEEDQTPPSLIFSPDPSDLIFGTGALPFSVTVSSDDSFAQISCTSSGSEILSASGSGQIILSASTTLDCTASDFMNHQTSQTQTFTFSPFTSQVAFSEILPNPKGADTDSEWMEFHNLSDQNISLANWTVTDGSKTHTFSNSAFISPFGFFFLPKVTSKISMGNSGTETFTLSEPDGTISDTLIRSGSAPSNQSFAKNFTEGTWSWTTALTPGLPNLFSAPPSSGISRKTNPKPISSSDLQILITQVSPKNSTADFAKFFCLDCSENGTDLGGWSIWDDDEILEIPLGFLVKQGETFTLEFKATLASDLQAKILRTSDSGLTSTDEQLILKDQDDIIESAVCWADQNGKWTSGEENQVASLLSVLAWSGSLASFDESICLDSSSLKSNQFWQRTPQIQNTKSILDWVISDPPKSESASNSDSEITLNSTSEIPLTDFSSISLSEILPNPQGSDADLEWLELQNSGDESLPLFGLILETDSSHFTFQDGEIPPESFLQIPKSTFKFSLKNSSGSLILKSPNGEILDQTFWDKASEDLSWAKISETWQWTSFLTPNSQNLPSAPIQPSEPSSASPQNSVPPLLDSDGDFIPDDFEKEIGSDPQNPDRTPASFSAWQSHLSSQTHLTQIQTQPAKISAPLISGTAPPGSKIHLILHSQVIEAVIEVGPDGTWNFTPDQELEAGSHTVFFAIEDQNQVRTPWHKLSNFELESEFLPPPSSVRISEIFPNPAGADDANSEWLELENFGDLEINLENWILTDPKNKSISLPPKIIPPHSFLQLFNSDLNLSFLNSRTNFVLTDPLERQVSSFVFDEQIPDESSLIFLPASQEVKLTLKPTPNSANLLEQKNSSQNPQSVTFSEIPSLDSGTWILTQGTVLTPSHSMTKNQLWISDGTFTLPLEADPLPDFQSGAVLQILGRVSHSASQPKILATHSDSQISQVAPRAVPPPLLLSPSQIPPLHVLVTVSGSIISRDRHHLILDSGFHLDSFRVDDFPLLEPGDEITVSGFTLEKNNQLMITPWTSSQLQIIIHDPLLSLLSSQNPLPKSSPAFPVFPFFGGIILSGSAIHLTRHHLKKHCLSSDSDCS